MKANARPLFPWVLPCAAVAALCGCSSVEPVPTFSARSACSAISDAALDQDFPAANTSIHTVVFQTATSTVPEHCQVDGKIDPRVGVDGQKYAINFRMRLPSVWNERLYMQGGSGTNGTLVDPTSILALGYATVGTDSGHDNVVNSNVNAGGTASFGVDPQARVDFAYNSYDLVARTGKTLVKSYFSKPQKYSYFSGCSEGGREAMLMSQRFPENFDGIIAGDPTIHLPLGPMAGIYTTQLFSGLATRAGLLLANGEPAIGKTYSDSDLMLVRNAVLGACDGLDGLDDGIVDNLPACTKPLVHAKLLEVQCSDTKAESCLSADQISTLEIAFDGAVDSSGDQLYSDWPWDAGLTAVSAQSGFAQNWRSWWLGSATSSTNTSTKLNFVSAIAVAYSSKPKLPFKAVSDSLPFSLAYNFNSDLSKVYATSAINSIPSYTKSSADLYFTTNPDISAYKNRGGKLMVYHGGSDSSVSVNDTISWYNAMNSAMGGHAQDFARMFVVPGMNHCSGGPATDKFDMLAQMVDWVEKGVAPESVIARASTPAFFGVAARTRPLCPYPKQSRYKGRGDVNDAANFTCQLPG